MESDKSLETLEEELKLMKGELKQSLTSVRDYLLNMELPSSEFATIIAALGGDGVQKMTMKGSFSSPTDSGLGRSPQKEKEESTIEEPVEELAPEETEEESLEPESELSPEEEDLTSPDESFGTESGFPPEEEDLMNPDEPFGTESAMSPEDELISQGEDLGPEAGLFSEDEDEEAGELDELGEPDEQDELLTPESELTVEEEQQMEHEKIYAEVSQSTTPKVNLLANLINWVARAKKEIGYEQMTTFLEVYGISGHLSSELKEVILHLSDITSEQPEDANTAEVWSQSMLSLHGILTGGDAPLHPLKPSWNDGGSEIQLSEDEATEAEVNEPKDMPLKLKLVFPNGDGKSKEFCVDLSPSPDNNES